MGEKQYRAGLPAGMPPSMRRLPVERGYPVPWFVAFVEGRYDFRVADPRKLVLAVKQQRCWVCGERLGREYTFVIGPMCAINRTTAEPPCHPQCAEWSARACPFLIQQEQRRREAGLPAGIAEPAGTMIRRQPGVALLWRTDSYSLFPDGRGGVLFRIGPPLGVGWLCEGRDATRAEVEQSIQSGLPLLFAECQSLADRLQLSREIDRARTLLPATVAG